MDLTPLDQILLRREEVKELLAGHGLRNARVVGWAGAGRAGLGGVRAEIAVDLPETTDLTGGDLSRIGAELTELVGVPVIVWAMPVGGHRILPGERIRYL